MPFDDMEKEARNRGAELAKVREDAMAAATPGSRWPTH